MGEGWYSNKENSLLECGKPGVLEKEVSIQGNIQGNGEMGGGEWGMTRLEEMHYLYYLWVEGGNDTL